MRDRAWIILVTAVFIFVIGGGLLLVSCKGGVIDSGTTSSSEHEDCDAEDYHNREDDCGFTDADRRKTKGPSTKAPTTKVPTFKAKTPSATKTKR